MKHVQLDSHASVAESPIDLVDLNFMGYKEAHEIQLRYVESVLSGKSPDTILMVEHPPVFTLGRQGSLDALLKSRDEITGEGVEIIHTERGGDITYHGPGQIVVYPIVQLRRKGLSVTAFIEVLEEIMIRTLADFGVEANRDARNRGVWVGGDKIGSVGIRVRHGVTFHGLALNVTLSLAPFSWIQPCGLSGVEVTSLAKQLGGSIDFECAKLKMKSHITDLL